MELIRLAGLYKTYHRGKVEVPVLRGIDLSIPRGQQAAIVGTSGAGKTTLINLLGLLDAPTAGEHWFHGREVSRLTSAERTLLRNLHIGFVFQHFNLLPRLTAWQNVMMPLQYTAEGLSLAECRRRARSLLEQVGLGDRLDHRPCHLSGGEQQRVAIARALVNRPALLIADEPTGDLDSRTSQEILDLLEQLKAAHGMTLVLVTHDLKVAGRADRIIEIADGRIEADRYTSAVSLSTPEGALAGRALEVPAGAETNSRRPRLLAACLTRGQRALWTARTAHTALRSNILRSFLTVLGIIIGVAALIAVAEVGKGSSNAIKRILNSDGVSCIVVQPGTASSNGVRMGTGSTRTLVTADADAIGHECPAVASVAPLVSTRQQVVRGNRNWNPIYIYGTTPSYLQVRDWEMLDEGEPFTQEDVDGKSLVCLLGKTVVRELFDEECPIGKEVCVNGVPLRVVGVLSRRGLNLVGVDQDDILLAPLTTFKDRVCGNGAGRAATSSGSGEESPSARSRRAYPRSEIGMYPPVSSLQAANSPQTLRSPTVDYILARPQSFEEIPAAVTQMTELLHERHRPTREGKDDFTVRDFKEALERVESTVHLVTGLVLIVSLISLAVGGVGIMNIMLVSVTERTREIGIRMAVGASTSAILRQFLTEAVVLSVVGGAIGIGAGRGTSVLIRHVAHWPTEPSVFALAVSVAVSIGVGAVFGYYPAWRASRMAPIEALRHD